LVIERRLHRFGETKRIGEAFEIDGFDLGTGRGFSVKQVLDVIAAETGEHIPVRQGARRPG
jgi:UDP-glucose 4-epimerase